MGKYLSDKDRDTRIEAAKLSFGFIEEHDKELVKYTINLSK